MSSELLVELLSFALYGVAVLILTLYILFFFTKKHRLSAPIYLVLFLTYFANIYMLALVSIDVSTGTYSNKGEETDLHDKQYFIIIWRVLYWTIQFLSWIVMPICQSYVENGEFSVSRKLLASVIENFKLYLIFFAIGVVSVIVLIIYLLSKSIFDFNMLIGIGISLSNMFGLLLLIFFLGHGVAAYPLHLWHKGDNERKLRLYDTQVVELSDLRDDAEENLMEMLRKVRYLETIVTGEEGTDRTEFRPLVDAIVKTSQSAMEQFPVLMRSEPSRYSARSSRSSLEEGVLNGIFVSLTKRIRSYFMSIMGLTEGSGQLDHGVNEELEILTRKKLVAFHRALIRTIWQYNKSEYQLENMYEKAIFLQDVFDAQDSVHDKRIETPIRKQRDGFFFSLYYRLEWFYYCKIRKHYYRIMALHFVFFCLLLLWSQITPTVLKPTGINLSPFHWAIVAMDWMGLKPLLQLYSLIIIAFMSVMIYFSLCHFKVLSFYQLIPHHSDGASLFFLAIFLCRITPSLCYNYLQVVGATDNNNIAFLKVMGMLRLSELKTLGGIFGAFEDYFTLIIILVAAINLMFVGVRIRCCMAMKKLLFIDNPSVPRSVDEDGFQMIQRERKRRVERSATQAENDDSHNETPHAGSSNSVISAAKRLLEKYRKKSDDRLLSPTTNMEELPLSHRNDGGYGSLSNGSLYQQELTRWGSNSSMNSGGQLRSSSSPNGASYQEWCKQQDM